MRKKYFDILKRNRRYQFEMSCCKLVDSLVSIFTVGFLASRFEYKYRAWKLK